MTDRSVIRDQAEHARRTNPQTDDARLAEIRARHQLKIGLGLTRDDPRDPVGYLLARVDQFTAERDAALAVLQDWIGSDWFESRPTQAILTAFGNPSLDEDDHA